MTRKVEKKTAPVAEPPEAPKKPEMWVFKSKWKRDQVTLQKTLKDKAADGSPIIRPGYTAVFDRNTWTTRDERWATKLRDIIAERLRDGNPLHVVETTKL